MIRCNSEFRAYALIRQIFYYCYIPRSSKHTPAYVNEVAGYSEVAPLIELFQLRSAQNVAQNLCLETKTFHRGTILSRSYFRVSER